MRLFTFVAFFGLQIMIWSTGNFSYLNYMTVALSTLLINNATLSYLFGSLTFKPTALLATPLYLDFSLTVIGSVLCSLQLAQIFHHFFPNKILHKLFLMMSSYHVVNRYGIFAIMTTKRYEIVIEGSDNKIEWKEYLLPHKPSELNRRPRRISPYQPRLDWQMWFLPFTSFQQEHWFQSFLTHLLKGTEDVLKLVRYNPFPKKPPKYIRSLIYDYTFTTWSQRKETGHWWQRTLIGNYSPILNITEHKGDNYEK